MVRLTLAEEELMMVFWQLEKPLTSVEIYQNAKDKSWNGNYIHKMLKKLETEQFIKVHGLVRCGKQYARQFSSIVSQEEYATFLLKQQRLDVKSCAKIALAFAKEADSEPFSQSLIDELEDMIAELRARGES